MVGEGRISIWFFVGSLLTVYGVIIFIVSLPALFDPAKLPDVVLPQMHAGVWWGALLLVLGVMYLILFWPWKKRGDKTA